MDNFRRGLQGEWIYIGGGTTQDAFRAAKAAGLRRFWRDGYEWYQYRGRWQHD